MITKKFYYLIKGELLLYLGEYKKSLKYLKKYKFNKNLEVKRLHKMAVASYYVNNEDDFKMIFNLGELGSIYINKKNI